MIEMSFDNIMPKPFPQFEIELNIYCIDIFNWNINQNSLAKLSLP